jgi:basic membrane lipoprotein Med (substrate-binding protein (PBP1-ABC) superfamily)
VAAVAAVAVAALVASAVGSANSTATIKAAWIYVGPHNDNGWSQAHDEGRLYVQKMLGSKVRPPSRRTSPKGRRSRR